MPRIAIARFAHEGNSFSPIQTTLADFRSHEWKIGAEVTPHFRGTNTEIGGAVAFLEAYASWQPTWLRVAAAEPSGPLAPGVFEAILDEILDGLRRHGPWDAVYLAQHGSLNVHDRPHADLDILRAVRGAIGPAPLGATFDLHANMSQEEVDLLDIAVGYKCHPHTDMAAVARKCLDLLLRRAAGDIRPVGVICPINAMLPSIFGRTTDGPMAEVKAIAAEIGRQDGLLDVTPFHGYTYGDSPVAGASAMVWADRDRARAIDAAGRLAAAMTARRDLLFVDLPKVPAAVDMAVRLARQPGGAPVALIDAADHPGAGAIADTPELLREILRVRPPVPTVCGCFFDPATVARARDAGLGGRIAGTLGARLTSWFGPPVPFEGRVERLSDGRIISTGPVRHGMAVDYGPSAVLDIGGIRVIAISRLQSVFDPAFFDLHAVQLDRLGILAIKAKNQFRAAFTSVFKTMIDVDAPGPAAYDFARLPWKVAPRTIYPLSGR